MTPELRAAFLHALDAAASEHAEEVSRLTALLAAERTAHRIALSEATAGLHAKLEESRLHVAYLTNELARRQTVQQIVTTYGTVTCRCGQAFEKRTKRQKVCESCKVETGRERAKYLRPK